MDDAMETNVKMNLNQKLIVCRFINERKSELFDKFASNLTDSTKERAWKWIIEKCKTDYGFNPLPSGKSWKYLRDDTWGGWKRAAKAKRDKVNQTGGEGGKEAKYTKLEEAVLDILGRDSVGVQGIRSSSPSVVGGVRMSTQETTAATASIADNRRRSYAASWSNNEDAYSTVSTATSSKHGRFSGDRVLPTETIDHLDDDPRSPEFFNEPILPPTLARQLNGAIIDNQDGQQNFQRTIAETPIRETPTSDNNSIVRTKKRDRAAAKTSGASSRTGSIFDDEETREEKKKSFKLHNELMATQIEYMKLKSESLKLDIELKQSRLRGNGQDDDQYGYAGNMMNWHSS